MATLAFSVDGMAPEMAQLVRIARDVDCDDPAILDVEGGSGARVSDTDDLTMGRRHRAALRTGASCGGRRRQSFTRLLEKALPAAAMIAVGGVARVVAGVAVGIIELEVHTLPVVQAEPPYGTAPG